MAQEALKKGKQSIARGGKGLGSKIHLAVSEETIDSVCLSGGDKHDMKVFISFCLGVDAVVLSTSSLTKHMILL